MKLLNDNGVVTGLTDFTTDIVYIDNVTRKSVTWTAM